MTTHTHAPEFSADAALPYATPVARSASPSLAGAAIILGGLGLVVLGGCFLIGVLMIVGSFGMNAAAAAAGTLTAAQVVLMVVLYLLAFACFAGAVVMLVIGVRGLLRVLRA